MPKSRGGAEQALERASQKQENGKKAQKWRICLTIMNDVAMVLGFLLCGLIAFMGFYGIACENQQDYGSCKEILEHANRTKNAVDWTQGVVGLTHGIWIVAVLQTLVTFFLGPIFCVFKPMNLICCHNKRREVLLAYSILVALLACAHLALLILSLLSNEVDWLGGQTLFANDLGKSLYAAGSGLMALILGGCVVLSESYRRNWLKRHNEDNNLTTVVMHEMHRPTGSSKAPRPMWEVSKEDVEFEDKIGEGHFGQCFKAKWRQQEVVVKKLKQGVRGKGAEAEFENFKRELEVCIQMRHPRICQFLGACTQIDNMFIVLEWMSGGSLFDLLHKKKNGGAPIPLLIQQKMIILQDVASGLNYLHEARPPIAHRDLSSGNVLLDGALRAKVADFGLSRQITRRMSKLPGNRFYMAPEVLSGKLSYSIEMDIYSFAIVAWETFARKRPFRQFKAHDLMKEVVLHNKRPDMPLNEIVCPKGMQRLIQNCWQKQPHDRPNTQQIISNIEYQRQMLNHRRESFNDSNLPSMASETFIQELDDDVRSSNNNMVRSPSVRSTSSQFAKALPEATLLAMPAPPALADSGHTADMSDTSNLSEEAFIQYNVEKAEKEMYRVLKTDKGQQVLDSTMRDSGMDRKTTEARLVEKMRIKARAAARREYAARYEHQPEGAEFEP